MNVASAANLTDVKVLDIVTTYDGVELKLQAKNAPANSYFFVKINKEEELAFEKLSTVLLNQKYPKMHKLNLEILSFSISPSGSYYTGESVRFLD